VITSWSFCHLTMPLYEYVCQNCGLRFEARQGFDNPRTSVCPAGHKDVRRLFGRPAIHFRGKGLFVTDNKEATNAGST
jgi:putative FmdB family regulatory protein